LREQLCPRERQTRILSHYVDQIDPTMWTISRIIILSHVLGACASDLGTQVEPECGPDTLTCANSQDDRGLIQKASKAHTHQDGQTLTPLSSAEWEKALGPEIDFRQMRQGKLGDCYFLAVLASIAYNHKGLLRNMFTSGSLLQGPHPVYTTEWLINGKKATVATNDKLPVDKAWKEPFFANGKEGTFWIEMLEKAFAKIFGDYKTIEAGLPSEAFKAVTQAPVDTKIHTALRQNQVAKQQYWQSLLQWSSKKFPMAAGTGNNNRIGIYSGHAYAVLEASEQGGKQVVKIYNPHGADKYSGVLPNQNKGDGLFSVTYDEFVDNFELSSVAKVETGSVVSALALSRATQSRIALEFDMKTNQPFAVQLEWPNSKFLKGKNCQVPNPTFIVAVAKKDKLTDYTLMTRKQTFMTNARADMPGGAGKYVIFVNVDFPYAKDWLKEFVVNVYGPPTQLLPSTQYSSPMDLFLTMHGLCKTILVPNTGPYQGDSGTYTLDESQTLNGMPAFVGDPYGQQPIYEGYAIIVWYGGKWQVAQDMNGAKQGYFYSAFAGIPGATCSESLLQEEAPPGETGDRVTAEALGLSPEQLVLEEEQEGQEEQGILTENGMDMANIGSTDLDGASNSCGNMVERLSKLGEGSAIATSGKDPEFPANLKSIAAPGTNCGDTAAGINEPCTKFNHWESLSVVKAEYEAGKSLEAKCKKDCGSSKACVRRRIIGGKSCEVDFSRCSPPLNYGNANVGVPITAAGTVLLPTWVCKDATFKATQG